MSRSPFRLPLAAACLTAAAALAACASAGGPGPAAASPDADRRFYEGRCGVCHVPFHPIDYPPRAWPAIVEVMGPKAGLSRSQRDRILRYLTADTAPPGGTSGASR